MPIRLVCEEWEKLAVGPGRDFSTLDSVAKLVEAWERVTGSDASKYFDFRARHVAPKSWFGSICFGEHQLEVLPPGSRALNEEQRFQLEDNIDKMLSRLSGGVTREFGRGYVSSKGSRIDGLVLGFCDEVRRARRQRIVRDYRGVIGRRNFPHGTLLFPQQLLAQIRDPQEFECSWVELTQDVPENQFIKSVLRSVRGRCSSQAQDVLDSLVVEFDGVSATRDPLALAGSIRLDRLSQSYKEVIRLGQDLLEGRGLGVFFGSLDGQSQVVISPTLFERYIAEEVAELSAPLGWSCILQERGTFLCAGPRGERVAELIPDIRLVGQDGCTQLVIDTKWKFAKEDEPGSGISREDASQVLVYAAKFGALDAAIIAPIINASSSATFSIHLLESTFGGRSYRLHVVRVPLMTSNLGEVRRGLSQLLDTIAFARSCAVHA